MTAPLLQTARTERERFELVAAAADLEKMRLRWRERLLACSPCSHHTDQFLWDDGRALADHPHRLSRISDALRLENRAASGWGGDWAEALPAKVLLCREPEIMLALECWDRPIAARRPPPPPPRAEVGSLNVLGAYSPGAPWWQVLPDVKPLIEVKRPRAGATVSAQLVLAHGPGARGPDMVGCHQRKPCILTAAAAGGGTRS